MTEESSSADVQSLAHSEPAGNGIAMGRLKSLGGQGEAAACVPVDLWVTTSTQQLNLRSVALSGKGRPCEREREGAGHEAVDIVEGIPSCWRRDGKFRHLGTLRDDWLDLLIKMGLLNPVTARVNM